MNSALIQAILAPIPGEHPGGMDMAHSPEFDEIRRLRKGDDPLLTQGDWVCEIRSPQWARVRELCEELLRTRTKDLQVACWYAEALTHSGGFQGLSLALETLRGLLDRFWSPDEPTLFPADQDERIAKFEWLNLQLPLVIKSVPMTTPASGGYPHIKWEESRAVENLGLRDTQARDEAIAEGKLAGEGWDKAATASGQPFYASLLAQLDALQGAFRNLEQRIGECFAPDTPDLGAIQDALDGCRSLAAQSLKRFAVRPNEIVIPVPNPREEEWAAPTLNLDAPLPPPLLPEPIHVPTGGIRSRTEAIQQLREIAKYFRTNEPHSPVALLVERAARWGEMSLEHWLGHVIKDENTLGQLHELLDLRREM